MEVSVIFMEIMEQVVASLIVYIIIEYFFSDG